MWNFSALAGRELRTIEQNLKPHHRWVDLVGGSFLCRTHGIIHRCRVKIAGDRRDGQR